MFKWIGNGFRLGPFDLDDLTVHIVHHQALIDKGCHELERWLIIELTCIETGVQFVQERRLVNVFVKAETLRQISAVETAHSGHHVRIGHGVDFGGHNRPSFLVFLFKKLYVRTVL